MEYIKKLKRRFNMWYADKFFIRIDIIPEELEHETTKKIQSCPQPIAVTKRDWNYRKDILTKIYCYDEKTGGYKFTFVMFKKSLLTRVS